MVVVVGEVVCVGGVDVGVGVGNGDCVGGWVCYVVFWKGGVLVILGGVGVCWYLLKG